MMEGAFGITKVGKPASLRGSGSLGRMRREDNDEDGEDAEQEASREEEIKPVSWL